MVNRITYLKRLIMNRIFLLIINLLFFSCVFSQQYVLTMQGQRIGTYNSLNECETARKEMGNYDKQKFVDTWNNVAGDGSVIPHISLNDVPNNSLFSTYCKCISLSEYEQIKTGQQYTPFVYGKLTEIFDNADLQNLANRVPEINHLMSNFSAMEQYQRPEQPRIANVENIASRTDEIDLDEAEDVFDIAEEINKKILKAIKDGNKKHATEWRKIDNLLKQEDIICDGVNVLEYNPDLFYCGTGAVAKPSDRSLKEQLTVPQISNFSCFIHDKQYGILGYSKELADKNFRINTYNEAKLRYFEDKEVRKLLCDIEFNGRCPFSEEKLIEIDAESVSGKYHLGVMLFGNKAYQQAQASAQKEKNENYMKRTASLKDEIERLNQLKFAEKQKESAMYVQILEKNEYIKLANDLLPKAENKLKENSMKNSQLEDEINKLETKNKNTEVLVQDLKKLSAKYEYLETIVWYEATNHGTTAEENVVIKSENILKDFGYSSEEIKQMREEAKESLYKGVPTLKILKHSGLENYDTEGAKQDESNKWDAEKQNVIEIQGSKTIDVADAALSGLAIGTPIAAGIIESAYSTEKNEINKTIAQYQQKINNNYDDISIKKLEVEKNKIESETITRLKKYYSNVIQENGEIIVNFQNEIDTYNLGRTLNEILK